MEHVAYMEHVANTKVLYVIIIIIIRSKINPILCFFTKKMLLLIMYE